MMFYKVYERKWGLMVAVCDESICEKTLEEGDLKFFVNPRFYKEKEGSKEEVLDVLEEAVSANLVGEEAVECGIKSGLIEAENTMELEGVPHAQAIVMKF